MQVSSPNDIKIYNLSSGNSLPEWLDERQRRLALKKDVSLRKRVQLIQDFDMPELSCSIQMSPDNQYIFATGMYKPRVKCYDVSQMSMKFERCMDSEPVKFLVLSEDYTKLVFLQSDRYIEMHNQAGRLHRTRIPFYGRDFLLRPLTAELYFVGISKQISRFNLMDGRFMAPLISDAQELNCCKMSSHFGLFACGSSDGMVECWDPRVRKRVAKINCAAHLHQHHGSLQHLPAVTSLEFDNLYTLGVGTSTGNICIYDMRKSLPAKVFDHRYDLPIKTLKFQKVDDENMVLSVDQKIMKIWNRDTGKPFTYIEPEASINDMCIVPNTGLIFMTNESTRIQSYFIPDLGQPPHWCSFLTSLTEELEEDQQNHLYDGFKFLTREQVTQMGMTHLIGTSLLKAEMHGYCIREEVFQKAKSMGALKYSEYKEQKLHEEKRPEKRVKPQKTLPKVNTALAETLQSIPKNYKDYAVSRCQLEDERYADLFSDPLFTVDQSSKDFQRVMPVVSRPAVVTAEDAESGDDNGFKESANQESSDEDEARDNIKAHNKKMKENKKKEDMKKLTQVKNKEVRVVEVNTGQRNLLQNHQKAMNLINKSFSQRITEESNVIEKGSMFGNKEMTFSIKKSDVSKKKQIIDHHNERKKNIRSASGLKHYKSKQF